VAKLAERPRLASGRRGARAAVREIVSSKRNAIADALLGRGRR
jgi:hypothetical protein